MHGIGFNGWLMQIVTLLASHDLAVRCVSGAKWYMLQKSEVKAAS